MHYFPIAASFIWFFAFLVAFLIAFLEIGVLGYAYKRMGIDKRYLFLVLLLSLFGSYINIPLYKLPPEQMVSNGFVDFFGIRYAIPVMSELPGTIIAINLGGAIIPLILSIYLVTKKNLFKPAILGVAIVTVIVHLMAYPVRGVGIAVPIFIPPIIATITALIISRKCAPALAYISGSMGTLIGADILNLGKIRGLGAPIASIGGAGTFDGIFLTGILAVLLASIFTKSDNSCV